MDPRTFLFALLSFCLLLTGCMPTGAPAAGPPPLPTTDSAPQAWLDAPLSGSSLQSGTHEVNFHAYGPQGISQIELSINGQIVLNEPNPDPDQSLMVLRYFWQAAIPGDYTLSVRAASQEGDWGQPAVALVSVLADPTEPWTATLQPTAANTQPPTPVSSPTPAATHTPSLTPTITHTPGITPTHPENAQVVFEPLYSSDQIYYNSAACGPRLVTIHMETSLKDVAYVLIFYRIISPRMFTTEWKNLAMKPDGHGWKTILNAEDLTEFETSKIEYLFAVSDQEGNIFRSRKYDNISVSPCP